MRGLMSCPEPLLPLEILGIDEIQLYIGDYVPDGDFSYSYLTAALPVPE